MITKSTLSVIAAIAMIAGAAQAHAETEFSTLAGIEAEPMNAQEMDAVQGKAWISPDLWTDGQIALNYSLPGWVQVYNFRTGTSEWFTVSNRPISDYSPGPGVVVGPATSGPRPDPTFDPRF